MKKTLNRIFSILCSVLVAVNTMAPTAVLATEFDESEEVVEETVESSPESEEEIVEEEEIIEEDSSSEETEEEETVDQKDSEEIKQSSKEGKIKVEASSESENITVRAWLDEKNIDNPEEVTMNVTDIKRLNKKDSESKEKKELLEEAEEAIGKKLGIDVKAEEGFQVEFKHDNKTIEPKEEIQLEVELKTPVKKDGEEEWSLWTYGHESSEEVTKDTKTGIKNSEEKTLENASNQIQTLSFPIQENDVIVLSTSNPEEISQQQTTRPTGTPFNIEGFLTKMVVNGQTYESGSKKIQLKPDTTYEFEVRFAEIDDNDDRQFKGNYLVFELPEGMSLDQFPEEALEIETPEGSISGNSYWTEKNKIYVTLNPEADDYSNVWFKLKFSAKVTEKEKEIHIGTPGTNNLDVTISAVSEAPTIKKTQSSYNSSTNEVTYVVTITGKSTEVSEVKFTDTLGSCLVFPNDYKISASSDKRENLASSDFTWELNGNNAFNGTIKNLQRGEQITLTYKAVLNLPTDGSKIDWNGTKNSFSTTSKLNEKLDITTTDKEETILPKPGLEKNKDGEIETVTDNEGSKKIIQWKIVWNKDRKINISGQKLTDILAMDNQNAPMHYIKESFEIVADSTGNKISNEYIDFPVDDSNKFIFTAPQTSYCESYTITYKTSAKVDDLAKHPTNNGQDGKVTNEAKDNFGNSNPVSVGVEINPGDHIYGIQKSGSYKSKNISEPGIITWKINVKIPANVDSFQIHEEMPLVWRDEKALLDDFVKNEADDIVETISLDDLAKLSEEELNNTLTSIFTFKDSLPDGATLSFSKPGDPQKFQLEVSGLNNKEGAKEFEISYKTKVNGKVHQDNLNNRTSYERTNKATLVIPGIESIFTESKITINVKKDVNKSSKDLIYSTDSEGNINVHIPYTIEATIKSPETDPEHSPVKDGFIIIEDQVISDHPEYWVVDESTVNLYYLVIAR